VRFTALLHHITVDLLTRSYLALEGDSAPGIDGVTWQAYGENLKEKLTDLHDRIHRGSYRARPARRTYIPKADGSQRPLAILCLEDKVVQQAVAKVLEAIEEDFIGFSYGFRPGRGQHDALDALHVGILRKRVNWVLDADIRAKWLKVGIIEYGRVTRGQVGAPQGAVISPTLANVYLHYTYDLWVQRWRQTKATGDIVVRFADDTIVGAPFYGGIRCDFVRGFNWDKLRSTAGFRPTISRAPARNDTFAPSPSAPATTSSVSSRRPPRAPKTIAPSARR
jgi:retron-type reverse transcriptase